MITGFSKLSIKEKIDTLKKEFNLDSSFEQTLLNHHHSSLQETYNKFAENTVSNLYLPYCVAPNFVINGTEYAVPMVIEESSVVAAASKAAKFWSKQGGFKTKVISTVKKGQIFFSTDYSKDQLQNMLPNLIPFLKESVADITQSMTERGGGILDMNISPVEIDSQNVFLLDVSFETMDSMGANFINSCLESMGKKLTELLNTQKESRKSEVIMAILSNYTPECIVECKIECDIKDLEPYSGIYSPEEFAKRFKLASDIAITNAGRAVTHNKGIMNGIDAVVLSTGNDFRAIEAGVHAYAAKEGIYKSLTKAEIKGSKFIYILTIPLAIGTVGGLTKLHPLAKKSLELLGNPNAKKLMQIIAAAGMANNFSAVSALVTSGIQKGHMKMHLNNILESLNANTLEKSKALSYFSNNNNNNISYSSVKQYLQSLS